MSTRANLELDVRRGEYEAYTDWLSDRDFVIASRHQRLLESMVINGIYGHIIASTMEHMRTTSDASPLTIYNSVVALAELTELAANNYGFDLERARTNNWLESSDFKEKLLHTQEGLASGIIERDEGGTRVSYLLPWDYAMTPYEGGQLAVYANRHLTYYGPEVARLLADSNYSLYFSPHTMASAADLLVTSIEDAVEADTEGKMPHLQRTNLAIGQIVQALAERSTSGISITDHGSGTGATLAAVIKGVEQAAESGRLESASIAGIESNPDFYRVLEDFAKLATMRLHDTHGVELDAHIGSEIVSNLEVDESVISIEGLTIVRTDLLKGVKKLRKIRREQPEIVTANYVWHRLTSDSKREIIRDGKANIYLVADLIANASEVNRRYFNFGNNGPLNCGNLDTSFLFEEQGFNVTTLSTQNAAALGVHPKLAEAIDKERDNDGFLWVAYRGEEASQLLGFNS